MADNRAQLTVRCSVPQPPVPSQFRNHPFRPRPAAACSGPVPQPPHPAATACPQPTPAHLPTGPSPPRWQLCHRTVRPAPAHLLADPGQHRRIFLPVPGQHQRILFPAPSQHRRIFFPAPGQHRPAHPSVLLFGISPRCLSICPFCRGVCRSPGVGYHSFQHNREEPCSSRLISSSYDSRFRRRALAAPAPSHHAAPRLRPRSSIAS